MLFVGNYNVAQHSPKLKLLLDIIDTVYIKQEEENSKVNGASSERRNVLLPLHLNSRH